jgi:hypothetical protein
MEHTNLPLEPYLLGCLIGDGGLCGNLNFASEDSDIVERVNDSLAWYGYILRKRSTDVKRTSEYTIAPVISNNRKYQYYFKEIPYNAGELLKVLPEAGYPITNHDTLHSVLGISTKTKKSNIIKYFPNLLNELRYEKLKDDQSSQFLNILSSLNLRCKSTEKRIPLEYFDASFENRLLLFQGLMDTDGCGSGNRLEFCVANEGLADDFARLAASLGYSFKKYTRQSKYFNTKYQEYRYGKTAYRIILDNIDTINPFLCERKLESYYKKREKRKKNGTSTCSEVQT